MRRLALLIAAWAPVLCAQSAGTVLELTSPLGTKFYSIPDEKGVVAAAQKAAAADPRSADLQLKLAQAHASVWQDQEAVAACTRGLQMQPNYVDLLIERGHRYLPLRQFDKARMDLSAAVRLDPKKMDAYYHLGLAHYFLRDFAKAADAFQHAVDLAPNNDERINSTNWLYASLRRANRKADAAQAAEAIPPDMTNTAPHTLHYLNLVRLFQGRAKEEAILPPVPPRDGSDTEAELAFDTVTYGVGNWHLYNGEAARAQEYFKRVLQGKVWITWGFVGSECEVVSGQKK